MRTNRLLSRSAAKELDIEKRIELEARVTDALGTFIQPPKIPPNWKFSDYAHHRPWRKHMFDFLGPLEGKTIIDLGCGYNPTPIYFALGGAAKVIACDVSPRAIEFVDKLASEFGVQDRVVRYCGPAKDLPCNDGSVDLVHGEAVLHHLDLDVAGTHLSRVLKKGGRAAFKDPLGHNPLLEFARDYLPYSWKHPVKGTDRPLRFSEIARFGRYFSKCEARGYGLFSMVAVYFSSRRNSWAHSMALRIDEPILRGIPFLQRACRFIVTCVEK